MLRNPFALSKVLFLDNIGPHTLQSLLAVLDLPRTAFLAISKSGATVETLSQVLLMIEAMSRQVGPRLAEHFWFITMPGDNPMRRLAEAKGIPVIDHDPEIGGRFSVLSSVGLIPAKVAGLDISALRRGARRMLTQELESGMPGEAARAAAAHAALIGQGKSISVLMPYCDRLSGFGLWFRQTWAESLGKQGMGSTPVYARGTVDQHSQLQLYLDGPRDKYITILALASAGDGLRIRNPMPGDPQLSLLDGKELGEVMQAHQRATAETFIRQKLPVRVIELEKVNEETLGALVMHMTLEIMFTAHLLGVNPFDQPAVEESKMLARRYLEEAAI